MVLPSISAVSILAWASTPGYTGPTGVVRTSCSPRAEVPIKTAFVRQGTFRNFSFQQVAGRNIGIGTALRAGDPEGMSMASRSSTGKSHAARAVYQDHAFQRVMGAETVAGKPGSRVAAHHGAKHGQSQRLVILALVFQPAAASCRTTPSLSPMVLKNPA